MERDKDAAQGRDRLHVYDEITLPSLPRSGEADDASYLTPLSVQAGRPATHQTPGGNAYTAPAQRAAMSASNNNNTAGSPFDFLPQSMSSYASGSYANPSCDPGEQFGARHSGGAGTLAYPNGANAAAYPAASEQPAVDGGQNAGAGCRVFHSPAIVTSASGLPLPRPKQFTAPPKLAYPGLADTEAPPPQNMAPPPLPHFNPATEYVYMKPVMLQDDVTVLRPVPRGLEQPAGMCPTGEPQVRAPAERCVRSPQGCQQQWSTGVASQQPGVASQQPGAGAPLSYPQPATLTPSVGLIPANVRQGAHGGVPPVKTAGMEGFGSLTGGSSPPMSELDPVNVYDTPRRQGRHILPVPSPEVGLTGCP